MAIRPDHYLGAGVIGIGNGLINQQQAGREGLLSDVGIDSNAITANLALIAVEAFMDHIIPSQYSSFAQGAVDGAVGITAMYLGERMGFGTTDFTGASASRRKARRLMPQRSADVTSRPRPLSQATSQPVRSVVEI